MKNALLTAGVFVGVVTAALVIWAVTGGSGGGSRHAALQEPTQGGTAGILYLANVNSEVGLPVRSFNFHMDTCNYNYTPARCHSGLEVLREPDAFTPPTLDLVGNTQRSGALRFLVGPDPYYMKFEYPDSGVNRYGFGRYEQVELGGLNLNPPSVGPVRGRYPTPNPEDVIGYMTVGSSNRYPILAFTSTVFDNPPSSLLWTAVVRRPIDSLTPTIANALATSFGGRLGQVAIELQNPGESSPHAVYVLGSDSDPNRGTWINSMTDSGAGDAPATEEITLQFKQVSITSGDASTCWYFRFSTLTSC
jgi:hypothetical protein